MKSLFKRKPDDRELQAVRFTISKMTLEPGDILVLRHPRQITRECADRMRAIIGETLNGRKCLVLEDGLDIAILSKTEIERQFASKPGETGSAA